MLERLEPAEALEEVLGLEEAYRAPHHGRIFALPLPRRMLMQADAEDMLDIVRELPSEEAADIF